MTIFPVNHPRPFTMLTVANLYLVKINQGIISPDKNYVKTALIYFDLTLDPPLLLRQIFLVL